MPRSKKQNIINQTNLQSPKEFLRFATPEQIANYRAERLKCNIIVELGAGIGGQTLAFSRKCKKVIAVEIDKKRVSILLQNLKKLRIKNVEIINGDALNKSVVQKISKESPDIIFFDTERPEQAERTLDKISPPIEKILETYSEISSKIAIEIPPFTKDIEQLKKNYNFEEEFISLDNQLNRLTLYFNELKSSEKSAVALPSKEKIYPDKNSKPQEIFSAKNFRYLYVIDPTIILADLEDEIAEKFNLKILNLDKPIFLSNEIAKSGFLIHYKILELSENKSDKIKKSLKKISAGKVVLRYKLNPEDYWKTRNSYEKELKGRREIHLFINEKNNEAILCEKV
jgi:hypothetical protein